MLIHRTEEPQIDYEFAKEVKNGLLKRKKKIKPRYFYDSVGSQLFEMICSQPEYYLARCELAILRDHAAEIVDIFKLQDLSLLELGSGSSVKTRILLQHLLKKKGHSYYFPIDVSHSILKETIDKLTADFPNLHVFGISSDYIQGIEKAEHFISTKRGVPSRKVVVFLGSSIGNFEPSESRWLLKKIRRTLKPRDILIVGFDLHKNKSILEPAYNDEAGVTAKFNLNLLSRINKDLGGTFVLDRFKHLAFYNEKRQRMEMHLISTLNQDVYIQKIGKTVSFRAGETIHTENSYKYTVEDISKLADQSNLIVQQSFLDDEGWFNLAVLSMP